MDCFLIGGVGCHFLRSVASFIDNIFYLSTYYDQGFEFGKVLGKEMFVVVGTRFDLNPKREWVKAHVVQTINL